MLNVLLNLIKNSIFFLNETIFLQLAFFSGPTTLALKYIKVDNVFISNPDPPIFNTPVRPSSRPYYVLNSHF